MLKAEFIGRASELTSGGVPFLFITDFEQENFHIFTPGEAAGKGVFSDIRGFWSNASELPGYLFRHRLSITRNDNPGPQKAFSFETNPVDYDTYATAFELVRKNILHGNSFLLNLTFPTNLQTNLTLEEVFQRSSAPYKLFIKDKFVVFSPECFVKIRNGYIYAYPMKGTMDAAIPDARSRLLQNHKEQWEHHTIVDLIRNDLSMVSREVTLTKFRYVDRIKTHKNELLQVSSEIRGKLPEDWRLNFGELFIKLLPAGSVSGAPKPKTLDIISEAEQQKRGYFTGVFGFFDGEHVDSGVMIRFIERVPAGLRFRSGGGITGSSDPETEYREMIDKVYVPIV